MTHDNETKLSVKLANAAYAEALAILSEVLHDADARIMAVALQRAYDRGFSDACKRIGRRTDADPNYP